MKVFYICRTGHHTSLLAAALHLGIINGEPSEAKKVFGISGFDKDNPKEIGTPRLAGVDREAIEIYSFGVAKEKQLLTRAAGELINIMEIHPAQWRIIDTSCATSKWTRVGQVAKKVRLHSLSKKFLYLGARREIVRLSKLIEHDGRISNL